MPRALQAVAPVAPRPRSEEHQEESSSRKSSDDSYQEQAANDGLTDLIQVYKMAQYSDRNSSAELVMACGASTNSGGTAPTIGS